MISNQVLTKKVWAVSLPYDQLKGLCCGEAVQVKNMFTSCAIGFIKEQLLLTRRKAIEFLRRFETHWLLNPNLGGALELDNLVMCPNNYHGIPHVFTEKQTKDMSPGDYRLIEIKVPPVGTILWYPETPVNGAGMVARTTCDMRLCL